MTAPECSPRRSPLSIALLLLAVLWISIAAGAGFLVGYSTRIELPMPQAIWHPSSAASRSDPVTISKTFTLTAPVRSGRAWLASMGSASLSINGQQVVATSAPRVAADAPVSSLKQGLNTVTIDAESANSSSAAIAYLEFPGESGATSRVVTDGGWNSSDGSDDARLARVVSSYGASPLGTVFGDLADSSSMLRGASFWVPLVCLMVAMAVACLAGPILRPADRSNPDTATVDLAIIMPSVYYASAACIITSLSAFGVGFGAVAAMQVAALVLFIGALIAFKQGSRIIEQDQGLHRAELSGYDTMQTQFELLRVTVQDQPTDFQRAVHRSLESLRETLRFAATSAATGEIDQRIISELADLERACTAGSPIDPRAFEERAQRISGLVRRREAIAQSSRRS